MGEMIHWEPPLLKLAFDLQEVVLGTTQQQLTILTLPNHVLKQIGTIIGPDTGVMDLIDHGSDGAAITAVGHRLLQGRQTALIFPRDREHGGIHKTDIALGAVTDTLADDLMEPAPVELDIDIEYVHT